LRFRLFRNFARKHFISTSGQTTSEPPAWRRRGPKTYHLFGGGGGGGLYPPRLALMFEKRLSERPGRLQGTAHRKAFERTAFDVSVFNRLPIDRGPVTQFLQPHLLIYEKPHPSAL
jgi:hypothetical protein